MKKFDKEFEKKLEETITAIESKTSTEVVVTIAPKSDSYCDTYLKGGLILILAMLLFLLYSPYDFPEIYVPFNIALSFMLGATIVRLFPPLKRLLSSDKRKNHYVKTEAYTFFHENKLTETRQHTALLIYISIFEKKCKLIADKGILTTLPAGIWIEIQKDFQKLFKEKNLPETILKTLPSLTEPLSKYLPPTADDINELPNTLNKVEQ